MCLGVSLHSLYGLVWSGLGVKPNVLLGNDDKWHVVAILIHREMDASLRLKLSRYSGSLACLVYQLFLAAGSKAEARVLARYL